MNGGHCQDCKHWTPPIVDLDPHYGDCGRIADQDNDRLELACIASYDGGELRTNARFGCVLLEPQ